MSRIGKRPIPIPSGITVNIEGSHVSVKGPKGSLERDLADLISIERVDDQLTVSPKNNSRTARQLHGLSRTLVANMIEGVFKGFEKRLQIIGVGYRAQAQGSKLTLNVGYSKPVEMEMPAGIQVAVEKNTDVIVTGIDKEVVGNVSAKIRAVRPPEPYKGKGIRYLNEAVRRKAGKTGK
ncbi:MAG: 50S ribosomal protein L6 [Cyanobacteria bacterium J06638_38]|uniref:50S ribosomal protein L6 n=1 Tax=Xenococcus sp. PCC 7305 TaxID=102125 RepID=UPI0002AC0782|nr:50S ribosomal protein L6 [Xenococcus sp. PCC 7305]ELS00551.1 ribosomal protein L6, bacterial type [Xenococcus sp. PCC 7305]